MLVAMAVGLVLLGGIYQAFFSTTTTAQVQESNSRIQENGRFAIEILKKDVRMAGYLGCANLNRVSVNVIAKTPPVNLFGPSTVLRGYESGNGWADKPAHFVAGTDVIEIHSATALGVTLDEKLGTVNANIKLSSIPAGIKVGDVLFISDCNNADVFRATNVSSGGGKTTIAHAANLNASNNLSTTYGTDAEVMSFVSSTYFIGNNAAGNPSLFRRDQDGNGIGLTDELVEHVETMQLLYGVDADGDRVVDDYVAANAVGDWRNVLSVKMALLLRGPTEVHRGELNTTTYSFYGTTIDPPDDRRVRQLFTATVGIRNRTQ
jgi:type IV pilus assembly protein PilW